MQVHYLHLDLRWLQSLPMHLPLHPADHKRPDFRHRNRLLNLHCGIQMGFLRSAISLHHRQVETHRIQDSCSFCYLRIPVSLPVCRSLLFGWIHNKHRKRSFPDMPSRMLLLPLPLYHHIFRLILRLLLHQSRSFCWFHLDPEQSSSSFLQIQNLP